VVLHMEGSMGQTLFGLESAPPGPTAIRSRGAVSEAHERVTDDPRGRTGDGARALQTGDDG
jgi:hypothetical protein